MDTNHLQPGSAIRDLGDGLILRQATPADRNALVDFNASIHADPKTKEPNEWVATWTRDLFERPHPTLKVEHFTVVENTKNGDIVSSLNLISQTWSYDGIEFAVGRPELVGTHPRYRNRGLVRAQFEVIHQWSAKRGEMLQAITGIPYYYRTFGYEMAVNLGGGRLGYKPQIPVLKEGQKEPFLIRPAQEVDLEFIAGLYKLGCHRSLVSCVRDEILWRYELSGKSEKNLNRSELRVIDTIEGEPVGFLAHSPYNWSDGMLLSASSYELKPGVSWAAVTPSVVRYLQVTGEKYSKIEAKKDFGAFGFWCGEGHPVYNAIPELLPRIRKPYAWYLRLTNIPGFLRQVMPVLEARLAGSLYAGHSGELKITFYRDGLKLIFDKGSIEVESWEPVPVKNSGDAAFPGLTFLQLLFGYRSFEELDYAFADCWYEDDNAIGLLNVLFPKKASDVWPLS